MVEITVMLVVQEGLRGRQQAIVDSVEGFKLLELLGVQVRWADSKHVPRQDIDAWNETALQRHLDHARDLDASPSHACVHLFLLHSLPYSARGMMFDRHDLNQRQGCAISQGAVRSGMEFSRTVAHELGHALNLVHPGSGGPYIMRPWWSLTDAERDADPMWSPRSVSWLKGASAHERTPGRSAFRGDKHMDVIPEGPDLRLSLRLASSDWTPGQAVNLLAGCTGGGLAPSQLRVKVRAPSQPWTRLPRAHTDGEVAASAHVHLGERAMKSLPTSPGRWSFRIEARLQGGRRRQATAHADVPSLKLET